MGRLRPLGRALLHEENSVPDSPGALLHEENSVPDSPGALSHEENSVPDSSGALSHEENSVPDSPGALPPVALETPRPTRGRKWSNLEAAVN